MKVAVIKYNAGNVKSVLYAMERLGANATLTDDWETIKNNSYFYATWPRNT